MTANASSSLAESPVELSLELASSPLLNPLAQAFLAGRDLDLLAPLRFVSPGGTPAGGAGKAPDRQDLARALGAANRAYGNPNADRWAARLADPATRLVGWKYELDGDRARLLGLAEQQMRQNRSDACVINGVAYGPGFGLVSPDGRCEHQAGREDLFAALARLVEA